MNYLPKILNQLNTIYNCKNNISNALTNQGQDMNNTSFIDYSAKIDNLYCNLNYVRFYNYIVSNLYRDLTIFNFANFTNMDKMFYCCNNISDIPELNTNNVVNMCQMFTYCNNLSNSAIQNIINMCINSNITNITLMNLNSSNQYSPLYQTIFDNSYYSNRFTDLTNAGWTH